MQFCEAPFSHAILSCNSIVWFCPGVPSCLLAESVVDTLAETIMDMLQTNKLLSCCEDGAERGGQNGGLRRST